MVESVWWVVAEKDKPGHYLGNLEPSLVLSLRYGLCGHRRLPRALCSQVFLRISSLHPGMITFLPFSLTVLKKEIFLSLRMEPVKKKVLLLFDGGVGEGRLVTSLTGTSVTVVSQLILLDYLCMSP